MSRIPSDNPETLPDHGPAVVSLADARARKELDETLIEIVRQLARQAADAHYDAVTRGQK